MSERERETAQTPDMTEEQPAISRKKRMALITYLAALLVLALLLVVLSMVIENKRLKDSGSDASSALARAELLQDENRTLSGSLTSTRQAYDLLLRAQAAQLTGAVEEFQATMAELADMTEYLSGEGLAEYDVLFALLPPANDE